MAPQTFEAEPVPAPKLPRRRDLRRETCRWWDTFANSPQAVSFTATDWEVLLMIVPVVDEYWRNPEPKTLGELRLQLAKFGATPEDRLRLRWTIKPPEPKGEAPSARKDPRLRIVGDEG